MSYVLFSLVLGFPENNVNVTLVWAQLEIKQKNACKTQTQEKSVTTMENVNAENANVIVIMLENFVLVIKMSVQSKSNVMPSDITNTGKKQRIYKS